MMGIVILSYVLAGLINLFYGEYYKIISVFGRAIVYPITALLVELPNIMVMYIIHWRSYKPQPKKEEEYVPLRESEVMQ